MQKILPWLGRSLLAGLVLASSAHAAPYSSMVVFGDSLSDSGNALAAAGKNSTQVISSNAYIPSLPYDSGVLSNGPVWATQFAQAAGLALTPSRDGGTNYAFGGARLATGAVPSVQSQVSSYVSGLTGAVAADSLFVVAGGGNDARDLIAAVAATQNFGLVNTAIGSYLTSVGTMVGQLQAVGAKNIVVWNIPDIGSTPAATALGGATGAQSASFIAGLMNNALTGFLQGQAGVQIFDIYGLSDRAQASGMFTNVTDACGNPLAACNATLGQSLFWDGIHPTTAAHALIASEMLTLTGAVAAPVPEPAEYAMFVAGLLVVGAVVRRQRQG